MRKVLMSYPHLRCEDSLRSGEGLECINKENYLVLQVASAIRIPPQETSIVRCLLAVLTE